MNSLSPLNSGVFVPYQHKVTAVARIEPVNLNLSAPLNPYPKTKERAGAQAQAPRARYSAHSANSAFAAQILVEAGLTGDDPFASARCAKAYAGRAVNHQIVRLVA